MNDGYIVYDEFRRLFGIQNGNQFAYFNVMPQGIRYGSSIYSSFLNWILSHLPLDDLKYIRSYIDDIFITGSDCDEVDCRLGRLKILLHHFGIELNASKTIRPETFAAFPGAGVVGFNVQSGGKLLIPERMKASIQDRLSVLKLRLHERTQQSVPVDSKSIEMDIRGIKGEK